MKNDFGRRAPWEFNGIEDEIPCGKCVGLWHAAGMPRHWISRGLSSSQVCLLLCILMQCNTHLFFLWGVSKSMQHIVLWEWCFGEVKVSQLWVSSRPEGSRSWENAMNTTQRASANMVSCDYENKKPRGNSVKSWMGQGFPTDGIKPVLFDLQNQSDLSYYLEIKRKEILELEILSKLRIICRNLCKTEAHCFPLSRFAPWVAIHYFSIFLEESSISQWDKLSFQSLLKLLFFQSHSVLDYSGLLMR